MEISRHRLLASTAALAYVTLSTATAMRGKQAAGAGSRIWRKDLGLSDNSKGT
jgi:hypothetical protein